MNKALLTLLAGCLSAGLFAASDDATLANRKWVRAYVATAVAQTETASRVSLAQTVSAPFSVNGTNGTLAVSFVEGTNPVLRCSWSNCTNLCPVGATFVWDASEARYRATNCAVSVAVSAEVVVSSSGAFTNVVFSGYDGTYDWTNRVVGSRTLLCRGGSTNVAFAVAFGRALDAEAAAIRAGLSVAEWRPSWPERILGAFMPGAYAAISQRYALESYQEQGDTWDALSIGDIAWSNTAGDHVFTGGGYSPQGLSLDLDAWAQVAADVTWEWILHTHNETGATRIEYATVLADACSLLLEQNDLGAFIADPENWGIQFPLQDSLGVVIVKKNFVASDTWKNAVEAVAAGVEKKLKRLARTALAKHARAADEHKCPEAPKGGWSWPGGCCCAHEGDNGVRFYQTFCYYGGYDACVMADVPQHDWRVYAWSNGALVRSSVGCTLCARCSSPLESEGAVHRMVPNTDAYDYNGCYCRYYYSAKPEAESTPVVEEFEQEDVTESLAEADDGTLVVTVHSNGIENVSLPSGDPRRKVYTVTYERGDVQHTVKMSYAAIVDGGIKKYRHDADEDECWSKDGLFHNFVHGRCAGVCDVCKMKIDPDDPEEDVTGSAVVEGENVAVSFTTDRMAESTEEDHTAYSAFDWENYCDTNGNRIVVSPHCGCACGLYDGMWTDGAVSNYAGSATRSRFNRSDFCTYVTEYKVPYGSWPGDTVTQAVVKCHCVCRCADNAAALKAKGRYHVHRPGDYCAVRCKSCGQTFSKAAVDVYNGVSATTGNFSKNYRVTQDALTGDEAKYAHTPITEAQVKLWMAAHPEAFVVYDLAGNASPETLEHALSRLGCGCACRLYAGESYEASKYGPARSDEAKKFHVDNPSAGSCGCCCTPNSHVHFVRGDGCPRVCGGCGAWGCYTDADNVVHEEQIEDWNWFRYHTTSGAEQAGSDGKFFCGCKCNASTNDVLRTHAKGGSVYGEDSYIGSDLARAFHSYRETTNETESCTCVCGHGPHRFESGYACPKICAACTNKVDDGTWSGRAATDEDHTRASGDCLCQCEQKVEFDPEWEVYYHQKRWRVGCPLDSAVCNGYPHSGYSEVTNKYRCVNCGGKRHPDWQAYFIEHTCYDPMTHTCARCGCNVNTGGVCRDGSGNFVGSDDCNMCKHRMCDCCPGKDSLWSDSTTSSGDWGVGEDENGDGQPELIIMTFTINSGFSDFGHYDGDETPANYVVDGSNVVYAVYSKSSNTWPGGLRINGDPLPASNYEGATKIYGERAPSPTNFVIRSEYKEDCSMDVAAGGYTNAVKTLLATNTLYDAVQWIRLNSTTNGL